MLMGFPLGPKEFTYLATPVVFNSPDGGVLLHGTIFVKVFVDVN